MPQALLELKDICYSYEGNNRALDQVSLSFYPGERVALLGCNGAGKSTLFLNCNGVLHPDSGTILYRGERIAHKKADLMKLRKHVGIVFQEPDRQLIASTVEAEVSFGPFNLGLGRKEVQRQVDMALETLHLEAFRGRAPHYLSGGEKKLVSIADVLAMEPEMILMDEPAAALDPKNVALFEGVLEELSRRDIALVIATHDVDFAWRWARRIIVLNKGEVWADDAPGNIFRDEALLEQTGIAKPCLFEVGQMLMEDKVLPNGCPLPQDIQQLRCLLFGK